MTGATRECPVCGHEDVSVLPNGNLHWHKDRVNDRTCLGRVAPVVPVPDALAVARHLHQRADFVPLDGCDECGQVWPCDFDRMRVLADELAYALKAVEMQWYIGSAWPMETVRAALAKWEASRAE